MAAIPLKTSLPPPRTVSGTRPAQQIGAQSIVARGKSSIPAAQRARVEIELSIFSDQPNPRWLLARVRSEQLLARLPEQSSLVPALLTGYRGFTVRIESDAGKRTVQVFHNAELERWLLNSGRFCLPEEMAKFVENQLH